MSFSQQIKEELTKHISSSRHCQLAEIAAIYHFLNRAEPYRGGNDIVFRSENEALIRKCFTLLKKTYNMYKDCEPSKEPINRDLKGYEIVIDDPENVRRFTESTSTVTVTQKACCRRAFLRGAFLAVGSISDPEKSYHLEFVCSSMEDARFIEALLASFEIESKYFVRKNSFVVYIKDGTQIVETLNVMEAHVALMEFENTRILKEMRNSVNRKVNCETANINKTVSAAQKQIDEINILMGAKEFKDLPESLQEIALLRIDYPDATLAELGELCNPAVGKSGVNHRLRKLSEAAAKVKGGEL